jgi:hypothetical protein
MQIEEKEIRKNEKDLLQYKKGDFLVGDIYGDGSRVPYKDNEYAEYKFFKNPLAGGETDLINEGNFINSFFLQTPLQNKYLFGASDSKAIDLLEKYGDEILSINKDKFKRFLENYVKDDYIKVLKKQLGQ